MGQICQSFGMLLKQDPQGCRRNADGNNSTEYCSLNYIDGAFILPDLTTLVMQQIGIRALGIGGPNPKRKFQCSAV